MSENLPPSTQPTAGNLNLSSDQWFVEKSDRNNIIQGFRVKRKLHEEQSKYQKIEIYETESLGRLLTLDGKTMVSDLDEFVYHETMAHVSTMVKPNAKRVLVIGGGDCGVITELARHPGYEAIHLVEIDQRVVEVSKVYFPKCTEGLKDPRVTVYYEDGLKFLEREHPLYDIIIVDSTDPENFATELFTQKFYKTLNNLLVEDGLIMAQAESPFYDEYDVKAIFDNMRAAFPVVECLMAPMPIYPGVYWCFAFASKKYPGENLDPQKVPYMEQLQRDLKWYNMDWHRGAFKLPNLVREKLGMGAGVLGS